MGVRVGVRVGVGVGVKEGVGLSLISLIAIFGLLWMHYRRCTFLNLQEPTHIECAALVTDVEVSRF